ncbi:anhydro-N-acetylmuramic acid kinase [Actinacidiphila yanglinensis]|uniref:Anhydro-N-acetylmuramic acid kinase n=1 Tax=Actinacidiphila yanglinensis TaxID=310779 RepID=A0A1H6B3E9_9ACTN|nr:anhydro-N-acetylmuramic acid kinase [Actinacidiphila yanglinensis]SEG55348.1 anhydro-N-acetylmuramic acid kinase [Actinacidiphila yanglinensis]
MIVVGLMSGTSMDGLDVAVGEFGLAEGVLTLRLLGAEEYAWPPETRERLLGLLPPAEVGLAEVCALDTLVGQASADAAVRAIERFAGGRADLVASHGQTVYHWVTDGRARGTLQLGQPAWITEATGLPVVSDIRARDIAAGGQGAPLASTLDALWLAGDGPGGGAPARRAALNLGGIANVTVVGGPAEPVTAFDTGPANCLLDAAAHRLTGGRAGSDIDGRMARAGTVRGDLLARLLEEPYYLLPAPKSTGRELFRADYVESRCAGLPAVTDQDLMATLTELSAVTVADACRPYGLAEVVASGGGVRNPALMEALRARLHPVPLVISDDRGLPAGEKEAYLMALLGFLSWYGIPGVVPGATGSATPRVLGRITPGDAPLRLPEPAPRPRRLDILPPA